MSDTSTSPLIGEMRERYAVGEHFAAAYLDYWQATRGRTEQSLEQIMSRPDPEPLWFDYAMSTNYRARNFFEMVRPHVPHTSGRYLDVGCGFGGCLVAFAEQGFEVCGIELADERVTLSRANCRDAGIENGVHPLSVLEENLTERIGTFDVITCLDVIEHVLDVPQTLRNMHALLNPGGVLLLEIPNMDSVPFVASDGHFNLYGITQLTREESIAYHERFFDFEYDVGYYHPQSYYENFLSNLGMKVSSHASPNHPSRSPGGVRGMLAELTRAREEYEKTHAPKLPADLQRTIARRVASYRRGLFLQGLLKRAGMVSDEQFQLRYMIDFWTLVAHRPA